MKTGKILTELPGQDAKWSFAAEVPKRSLGTRAGGRRDVRESGPIMTGGKVTARNYREN
jgi:hypothetical protein